jgi:broad specificity phosphatase PhoE
MKEDKEKRETPGNHSLEIIFIRHSSKRSDGNLSDEGRKNASEIHLPSGKGVFTEVFTSNIQRSIDTGKIISEKFGILKLTVDPALSEFPYTDEKIEELGLGGGKWLLLKDGNEHLPSTKFMAGKVAKFLLNNQAAFMKLDKNQNAKIIAVSHIPPMMCFLGHIMALQTGKDFIDESIKTKLMSKFENGFFKPLEGFQAVYSAGVYKVNFSEESFSVPISFLQDLATTANSLHT